ncbi:MAG: DUF3955 domain-containing protein [Myxococcaceae bacterium]|nr:DUF3955 domain-containing protein [Myxococcaceae bacterium]MBH2006568.1 DUF3955 domain-containing protein [Myxococcaceae bacterium]
MKKFFYFVLLALIGIILLLVGENMSYVDQYGMLVDYPILVLTGACFLITGTAIIFFMIIFRVFTYAVKKQKLYLKKLD